MNNSLFDYTLHLADNALILGHKNSEWTGHGPILEQDIALSNIALDLVGQARNFYQYAAQLTDDNSTEDALAYLRDPADFKNCLLVEQSNGDWAKTISRQFIFSVYQYYLYQQLQKSENKNISGIAEKALKEVTYHVRWSSEWVIRLGDGTIESNRRMKNALTELWEFTDELFLPAYYEKEVANDGIGIDLNIIKSNWNEKVEAILQEATLPVFIAGRRDSKEVILGKEGKHTQHLNDILAEMQFLQRAYPGCDW